jgi:hypothetical protein
MADGDLQLDAVEARAEVAVSAMDVTAPGGGDGTYTLIRIRGEGPVTSSDSRLAGIFRANAVMLVNERGEGVGRDDWEILDARDGTAKATGVAHGIHNDPDFHTRPAPFAALSIGRLADGTRLFAHARVTLPPPNTQRPIVIEYGGPGLTDPANRAVAVAGRCDGLLDDDHLA